MAGLACPQTLVSAMGAAGFTGVQLTHSPRDGGSAFRAFLLTGFKGKGKH